MSALPSCQSVKRATEKSEDPLPSPTLLLRLSGFNGVAGFPAFGMLRRHRFNLAIRLPLAGGEGADGDSGEAEIHEFHERQMLSMLHEKKQRKTMPPFAKIDRERV